MKKSILALLFFFIGLGNLTAQKQVTNLFRNSGEGGSSPDHFIPFLGKYLFEAYHPNHGRELWITDGNAGNTFMLKDINQSREGSLTAFYDKGTTIIGDEFFFMADDGVNGQQVWKTNGTSEGTKRVGELVNLDAGALNKVGNKLILAKSKENSSAPFYGAELWSLDPTTEEYSLISDDFDSWNRPNLKGEYLGMLFFTMQPRGSNNTRLWRSDGTTEGTFPITSEIDGLGIGGNTSDLSQFTVLEDHLYLIARKSGRAVVLKTDGTLTGTSENNFLQSSFFIYRFGESVVHNGTIYFSFYREQDNRLLIYAENGQRFNAVNLYDRKSVIPSNMVIYGNKLIFMGSSNSTNQVDLMQMDLDTKQVEVLTSLETSVTPRGFEYFTRGYLTPTSDDQLLISYLGDNYELNSHVYTFSTGELTDVGIGFYPELIGTSFGVLYPGSTTTDGRELWKAGPAVDDAALLININEEKNGLNSNTKFQTTGSKVVFFGADEVTGLEPRVYDEANNQLEVLEDLVTGEDGTNGQLFLSEINGLVYYFTRKNRGNLTLFETDGTPGAVKEITSLENFEDWPRYTAVFKNDIYIGNGKSELRVLGNGNFNLVKDFSDPATFVQDVVGLKATENNLFIKTPQGLFASEGTESGTIQVISSSRIDALISLGSNLYFTISEVDQTSQLWKSDGTVNGTLMVKDLGRAEPTDFFTYNGKLIFTAISNEAGRELWISDGTENGTQIIKDIRLGTLSGLTSTHYALLNGELYFSANDGSNGLELWKTDGSSEGTEMVSNISDGNTSSKPRGLLTYGNKIYFTAYTPSLGNELWESDGTSSGTKNTFDLVIGAESSHSRPVLHTENDLYFISRSNETGFQLWRTGRVITGIEDQTFDNSITAFPNPANQEITLRFSTSPLWTKIDILDANANRFYSAVLDENFDQTIDISDLPQGLYIVRIIDIQQRTSFKKILKLK